MQAEKMAERVGGRDAQVAGSKDEQLNTLFLFCSDAMEPSFKRLPKAKVFFFSILLRGQNDDMEAPDPAGHHPAAGCFAFSFLGTNMPLTVLAVQKVLKNTGRH